MGLMHAHAHVHTHTPPGVSRRWRWAPRVFLPPSFEVSLGFLHPLLNVDARGLEGGGVQLRDGGEVRAPQFPHLKNGLGNGMIQRIRSKPLTLEQV